MTSRYKWFLLALVTVLIGAPNATVLRAMVLEADVYYMIMLRFGLVALVCLPLLIKHRKAIFDKKVRKSVIIASAYFAIGLFCYNFALLYSQASYVTIISLTGPILLIVFSSKFFGEKINRRIASGVTLAVIGAMTLVILPIALSQNGVAFYPVATVLALVNCVVYSLSIIYMRRANEAGAPMSAMVGISALVITVCSAVLFALFGDKTNTPFDPAFVVAIIYSGIIVGIIGRVLYIKTYEHNGASIMGAMGYLEMFMAILIPVFVLNEKLSPAMVVGGILILIGVYIVEHHKHPHAKHHITMRHH